MYYEVQNTATQKKPTPEFCPPLHPMTATFTPRKTESMRSRAVNKCDPQIIDEKDAILHWCLSGNQKDMKDDSHPTAHTSTGHLSVSNLTQQERKPRAQPVCRLSLKHS